ncbi:MAG: hypothetical protein PHG95_03545 [Patescibacteria group bacterium]|nr:hypothetical protein [Patescibacteria group bacterium]
MGLFSKYKKIWLLLAFIAFVGLMIYLIWIAFFRNPVTSPAITDISGNIGGLNTADDGSGNYSSSTGDGRLNGSDDANTGSGQNNGQISADAPTGNEISDRALGGVTKVTALTSDPVLDPTMTSNGELRYYNQNDGKFYKLDSNGDLLAISDKVFHQVSNVTWSTDGNKAILEYPDGSKITYDFQTQKQVTLPKHWEDFSFSPSGNQISAKSIGNDVENRYLITANADGSKAASLSAIGENADDVYPVWSPNNQAAAMYTRGVDFNRQEVFFVGLNGENFKSTIINGRGFEPEWSDEGDKLLYSVYSSDNNMNPSLWIVDAQGDSIGQNRTNLGLSTWASKCTFATNDEVYCAVPENLPQGAGLFPELADKTTDNLYKIDLTTGAKKLIAIPSTASNVSSIMVGSDQQTLYFTDKSTGKIYEIKL